jgi:hypothetical protein
MRSGIEAQQSREWLKDRSGDAEEAVVNRIRLIEPISAHFGISGGDAIRNLRSSLDQVAYQLAVQHSGPLTEDAERMTQLPIRISGAQLDDWATSKNKQTKPRRSEIFGKAGFRTIRSGQPFAFAERLRRSADDRGRTPLTDRRRLRGTTIVLNRLRDVYKHRRLLLRRPRFAREGGR